MMAREVAIVHDTAGDMAENCKSVNVGAGQLNETASRLNRIGGSFKTTRNRVLAGQVKSAHSLWKQKMADLTAGKPSLTPDQVTDHQGGDLLLTGICTCPTLSGTYPDGANEMELKAAEKCWQAIAQDSLSLAIIGSRS